MSLHRSTHLRRAALVLLLAAAQGLALAADEPRGGVCRDDARTHCSGVQPGGGRVADCLKQHEADLSATCKAALPAMQRCADEVRQLCGNDAKPRKLRSCLRDNAAKLSPECRAAAAH